MKKEVRSLIDSKISIVKMCIESKKDITKNAIVTKKELECVLGDKDSADTKSTVKEICCELAKWIQENTNINVFVSINNKNDIYIKYNYKNILGYPPKNTIGDYFPKNIKEIIEK